MESRSPQLRNGFTLGGRFDRTLSPEVAPSFTPGTDEYWMEQALLAAMDAIGWSAPNPSVGAVLVDPLTGRELARGYTQAYRHEHAERRAILAAQESNTPIEGATLFVTLEPCSHFGHQPPCADLIVQSGIRRVVIGCGDPDARVSGQGIARLRAAGIEVTTFVLEPECRAWHDSFLRTRVPGKSIAWAGKWAQTPEGDLARPGGDSKWISGPSSRAYTHWLRQKYDAILVTADTFLRDLPRLNVRDCAPPIRRHPLRIVLDRTGKLDASTLESGIEVVDSIEAVEALRTDPPLQSVMVEGGPTLLNGLIQQGKLDVVHQFIGPKSFDYPEDFDPRRYRIQWSPDPGWICAVQQKIGEDTLREWVKSF